MVLMSVLNVVCGLSGEQSSVIEILNLEALRAHAV